MGYNRWFEGKGGGFYRAKPVRRVFLGMARKTVAL
jgi:hypothetical protein